MQEGKKDIHNTDRRLKAGLRQIRKSSMSEKQKKKIEEFIEDLKIGKIGKKVGEHRINSYIQFLIKLHNYFKKDLDKITEKEARQFYLDLVNNKIRSQNKVPFSLNTKDLYVRTLKRYVGYCLEKDSSKYKKTVGWLKEDRNRKTNRKAIALEQTEKVLKQEKSSRNRALFMFLFDSGARIEEALNVKIGDLEIKKRRKGKGDYFMVDIKYSKTEPRRIAIPLSTKYINSWLKAHPTGDKKDYLFPFGYQTARIIIKNMSKKALGFSLSPHELRHSSATYYIQHIGGDNMGAFFYRYGWSFDSKIARVYIKRNLLGGEIGQERTVRIIEADRVEHLDEELENLKIKYSQLFNMVKKLEHLKVENPV